MRNGTEAADWLYRWCRRLRRWAQAVADRFAV